MQDEADPAKVDARNAKQIAMGNPPFILGLSQMAMRGMLPTPNSYDWNTAAKPETYLARSQRHKDKNVNLQMSLRQMTMFIPNKVDHPKLGTASQLNPHFVAEMMGFPLNWTDLPFLSGEKKV
jgi:hypothetical protein